MLAQAAAVEARTRLRIALDMDDDMPEEIPAASRASASASASASPVPRLVLQVPVPSGDDGLDDDGYGVCEVRHPSPVSPAALAVEQHDHLLFSGTGSYTSDTQAFVDNVLLRAAHGIRDDESTHGSAAMAAHSSSSALGCKEDHTEVDPVAAGVGPLPLALAPPPPTVQPPSSELQLQSSVATGIQGRKVQSVAAQRPLLHAVHEQNELLAVPQVARSLLNYGDGMLSLSATDSHDSAAQHNESVMLLLAPSPEKKAEAEAEEKLRKQTRLERMAEEAALASATRRQVSTALKSIITLMETVHKKETKARKSVESAMERLVLRLEQQHIEEHAAPAIGSFSNWVKPEKPKHPPVRHTSMRLYDSGAIKAKRAQQVQEQQRRKAEEQEAQHCRDFGLPQGVSFRAFLELSNRAIYCQAHGDNDEDSGGGGGDGLYAIEDAEEEEDDEEDEEKEEGQDKQEGAGGLNSDQNRGGPGAGWEDESVSSRADTAASIAGRNNMHSRVYTAMTDDTSSFTAPSLLLPSERAMHLQALDDFRLHTGQESVKDGASGTEDMHGAAAAVTFTGATLRAGVEVMHAHHHMQVHPMHALEGGDQALRSAVRSIVSSAINTTAAGPQKEEEKGEVGLSIGGGEAAAAAAPVGPSLSLTQEQESLQELSSSLQLGASDVDTDLHGMSLEDYHPMQPMRGLAGESTLVGDKFGDLGDYERQYSASSAALNLSAVVAPQIAPVPTLALTPVAAATAAAFTGADTTDAGLMGVKGYTQQQMPPRRVAHKPTRPARMLPAASAESAATAANATPLPTAASLSPRAPLAAKPLSAVHGRRVTPRVGLPLSAAIVPPVATAVSVPASVQLQPAEMPSALVGNQLRPPAGNAAAAAAPVSAHTGALDGDPRLYGTLGSAMEGASEAAVGEESRATAPADGYGGKERHRDETQQPLQSKKVQEQEKEQEQVQVLVQVQVQEVPIKPTGPRVSHASVSSRRPRLAASASEPVPAVVINAEAAAQAVKSTAIVAAAEAAAEKSQSSVLQRRLQIELRELEEGMQEEEARQGCLLQALMQQQGVHFRQGEDEILGGVTPTLLLGDTPEQQLGALARQLAVAPRQRPLSPPVLLISAPGPLGSSTADGYCNSGYPSVPPSHLFEAHGSEAFFGNKSPARLTSGSNTTMSNPRRYDTSNITDIGSAIENMRLPRAATESEESAGGDKAPVHVPVDAEAEDDANGAADSAAGFDPVELWPGAKAGGAQGAVLSIRSGLSASQEQEQAFLDEERRRRRNLASLRDKMQMQGQPVPVATKAVPVPASASRGKAEGGASAKEEANRADEHLVPVVPRLALVPPAHPTSPLFDESLALSPASLASLSPKIERVGSREK